MHTDKRERGREHKRRKGLGVMRGKQGTSSHFCSYLVPARCPHPRTQRLFSSSCDAGAMPKSRDVRLQMADDVLAVWPKSRHRPESPIPSEVGSGPQGRIFPAVRSSCVATRLMLSVPDLTTLPGGSAPLEPAGGGQSPGPVKVIKKRTKPRGPPPPPPPPTMPSCRDPMSNLGDMKNTERGATAKSRRLIQPESRLPEGEALRFRAGTGKYQ